MKHYTVYLSAVGLLVLPPAESVIARQADAVTETNRVIQLDDMMVHGEGSGQLGRIPFDLSRAVPRENADPARALTQVPGVAVVTRGAGPAEPVLRGMGWERVTTQLGCLALHGACPSRMDPPLTYTTPLAHAIDVHLGLPSVTLGSGGTGGRLHVNPDYDRGPQAGNTLGAKLGSTYDSSRDGVYSEAAVAGGTDRLDARATGEFSESGDYESASGATVPAGGRTHGGSLTLGFRPMEHQRAWGSFAYKNEADIDFPALPMDIRESESYLANGGYRLRVPGESLERLEVQAGYAKIDHVMDNADKPNRTMMEAAAVTEAESASVSLASDWRTGVEGRLTLGIDVQHTSRDALRTRFMRMKAMTAEDPIWPDARQNTVGLFGEYHTPMTEAWSLRAGVRADRVSSDIGKADSRISPAMGVSARTVREGYAYYYGDGAADVGQSEVLGAANIQARWQYTENTVVLVGAGLSTRPAGLTERYFAFAPAPGGYLVGNPDLDAEKKGELVAELLNRNEWMALRLALFSSRVNDYILNTRIDQQDVNMDGNPDNIKGFQNVDALFVGGECSLVLFPLHGFSIPMELAYVRGENLSMNRNLPEIPPLSGSAAIRYDALSKRPWWLQAGLEFAADQNSIDTLFPEDTTSSWDVYHLRGGINLNDTLALEAGIENLFDEEYSKHLTREAMLATGDLTAGAEIPEPSRYGYVSLKVSL